MCYNAAHMNERLFIQYQDTSTAGTVHSGIFVVDFQTLPNDGNENVTLAVATPTFDSQSNAEFAQSTGTPLAEELTSTGLAAQSGFGGSLILANSSGDSLQTVVSNFVAAIRTLGDEWCALRITSQNEEVVLRTISDSRGSS